ncbi:metallophosphoesterase [uncultured Clostridium sp.]|uniref:metallophosphoesterase n=1 Tax=uncultured Clostridium sp. TaxID=59620 RepID=UPI0025947EE4|nr:metallophosphoesterase [uncultured Clostridium sp.]
MKNKKFIIILIIALVLISIFMCFITKIDLTKYEISNEKIPEEFDGFKIVQLSDFHSEGYRNTTEELISKVQDINPDIIVMTGDMVSCDIENIEEVKFLIESLAQSYSIYYIDGNHEHLAEFLRPGRYVAFIEFMQSLGVTTITNDYVEIYRGDASINLYGINIPLDWSTGLYVSKSQLEKNYVEKKLPEVDEEKFNILLAHNPIFFNQYREWGANLILSGHMHGGIIRIPFTNIGLLSPERSIFPRYDSGEFSSEETTMIVNRGIGTSSFKLRIFNNPEISVITLKSK